MTIRHVFLDELSDNVLPMRFNSLFRKVRTRQVIVSIPKRTRITIRKNEYLLHSGRTAHQLVYDALENEIRVTEYVLKRDPRFLLWDTRTKILSDSEKVDTKASTVHTSRLVTLEEH